MTDTMTDAARELALYTAHCARAWRAVEHMARNYERRIAKGTYCPTLARKGMLHPVEMAAREYVKDHCGPSDTWHGIFAPADRQQAADSVMSDIEAEWAVGNYWGKLKVDFPID